MKIVRAWFLFVSLFMIRPALTGQTITTAVNHLTGVWSDKDYLDSLNSHHSITLAFQQQNKLYDGIYIQNDTVMQALYPEAMEEDWLYYNAGDDRFQNSRGAIKILEVIDQNVIKANVQFKGHSGIKYFVRVFSEQEVESTHDPLQQHSYRLYRMWFAGKYDIIDFKDQVIGNCLFTQQGNAEGLIDNCLYAFFLWDVDHAVLRLENWKTKAKTYYLITYQKPIFLLEQVKEPEWRETPKPLVRTGQTIQLRKRH